MADVDAEFVQKILHIPQRERKPHIHHNGQPDDLWARLKVTKGGTFCHPTTLISRPARLKKISSDRAHLSKINEHVVSFHQNTDVAALALVHLGTARNGCGGGKRFERDAIHDLRHPSFKGRNHVV
jgi:hypothetical protein